VSYAFPADFLDNRVSGPGSWRWRRSWARSCYARVAARRRRISDAIAGTPTDELR
jgi:hypothetical protein